MPRIQQEVARGVRELEADLGNQVIVWKGITLICIPKTSVFDLQLTAGGLSPGCDATFIVNRARLSTLPKPKEYLVSDGKRFVISNVNESADKSFVRLDCDLPDKRV